MAIKTLRRADGTEYQKLDITDTESKGRIGEYVVIKALNDLYSDIHVKRTAAYIDQINGIDAYVYDPTDHKTRISSIEIKTDFHDNYNSIFVEDHSDFYSGETEIGYLNKSKADWLCYYFPNRSDLDIYLISFKDFREIMKNGNYKLRCKEKPSETETTYFYILPLQHIIDHAYKIPANIDYKTMEKIYNNNENPN